MTSGTPGSAGDPAEEGRGVRLQKVLAAAGHGSRRTCDALIDAGRVRVNGVVAAPGTRVDASRDVVTVDSNRVVVDTSLVYLAVNKPVGMLSAMSDDRGRPTVGDLVADLGIGLHHVGRLDADSEGLLLVTNDGALSHRLTHPSYEVPKVYVVEVEGVLPRAVGRTLRAGVELEDGRAVADDYRLVGSTDERSMVEVTVHEGRHRLVRRMFDEVGFPVIRLVRVAVGPIALGDLRTGRFRHLSVTEVGSLYRLVDL